MASNRISGWAKVGGFVAAILIAGAVTLYFWKGSSLVQDIVQSIPVSKDIVAYVQESLSLDASSSGAQETYVNTAPQFSLAYPHGYRVGSSVTDDEQTILFQNEEGKGFQLVVAPFAGAYTEITPERLRADLPELDFRNESVVDVDGKANALSFIQKGNTKDTREIWFIYDGHLYQATAFLDSDSVVLEATRSLEFK